MSDLPSHIVYVDDEDAMRQLVTTCFERAEGETSPTTCETSKEFLEKIGDLKPELLLLDLNMPDMSGPDTIAALKETDYATVPIIFMTGYKDVTMTDEYKSLGVIGVIHKPFETASLVDTIKGFWSASQSGAEAAPAEEAPAEEPPAE